MTSLDDYRIAPFHLLATEGAVHMDRDHRWHMETLGRLTERQDPMLMATPYRVLDPVDAKAVAEGEPALVARIESYRLHDDNTFEYLPSFVLRGLKRLHLDITLVA